MEFSFRNVLIGTVVVVLGIAFLLGSNSPLQIEKSETSAALGGSISAPLSLIAQRVSDSRIMVEWVYGGSNPNGFELERGIADCSGGFSKISALGGAARRHADTGLPSGGVYCYRVRAFGGSGAGRVYSAYTYSNGTVIPPGSTPPPPGMPPSSGSSREEAALVKFSQLHFAATARIATNASIVTDLPRLQQLNEGVSDNPNDIAKRTTHFFHEAPWPIPASPISPDIDETALHFARRSLLLAAEEATYAATLTDLRQIQEKALLLMAISDAADLQLRIAIRELRGD